MYMDVRAPARRLGEAGYYFVESSEDKPSVVQYLSLDSRGEVKQQWTCSLPKELPPGHLLEVFGGPGRCLLYAGEDSQLYVLDDRGQILCRMSGGGVTGVPIVTHLGDSSRASILVNDAHAQLLCLSLDETLTRPILQWRVPSLWNGTDTAYVNHGEAVPVAFDWDQDGRKEILVGQPDNRISILNAEGRVEWSCSLPNRPFFWNYGEFTGGDGFDVFVSMTDAFYGKGCRVYSPNQGQEPVWSSSAGAFATAVWDLDGDGRDDLILRDLFWRRFLDGATGRDILPITQWAGYHMPTVLDPAQVHNDIGVVWTGGNYSLVAETFSGHQVWWKPMMSTWHPGVIADVDGDGRLEVGAVTWGQVFNWPAPIEPVPGLDRAFVCLDLESGEVKWAYDPGVSMSGVVAADVDGDGLPEFTFGTGDGRLIALRGGGNHDQRVVFSVQFPAALSMPVICDPLGSGQLCILVGCADGNLYLLR
jgi:hypothetical protein